MQMTEGSSVPCHVIQGTCAEIAQLRQLSMATNMENWSGLEDCGINRVSGLSYCQQLAEVYGRQTANFAPGRDNVAGHIRMGEGTRSDGQKRNFALYGTWPWHILRHCAARALQCLVR
jgi:hypothetical protein